MSSFEHVKEEFERTLTQAVEDGKIPHAIVHAISKDGSFRYSFATGKLHYGIDDTPVREDSVIQLASQTKLLTTIAALQAVERGVIGLDDDVSPHIPELGKLGLLKGFDENDKPILSERKKKITLRHLLTHSSGANYAYHPDIIKHNKQRGLGGPQQDLASTILERYDSALLFEPGESWMYSPGLDWTGLLLHRLTSHTLEELMQQHIFEPLAITDMTFWPHNTPLASRIPTLVGRDPKASSSSSSSSSSTLSPYTEPHLNTHSTDCFGGHGVYASLQSYLRILHSLLANDSALLSPATVTQIFTPQLPPAGAGAMKFFFDNFADNLPGEINHDVPLNFGLGGGIFLDDDVGRRRKGTLFWSGLFNPFWLVDREAGLAFTFGTQVMPSGDKGCKEMTGVAERAVYKMMAATAAATAAAAKEA